LESSILGCTAYYNRFLAEPGIPYVFECTGDSRISSPRDFASIALESASTLSELLGVKLDVYGLEHWEYIGRRFNLYAFSLRAGDMILGQVRVVETGGFLVNVSGVLSTHLESLLDSSLASRLKSGSGVSVGYNMGITLLRGRAGGWPLGQKAIPKYVIYAAEGIPEVDVNHWKLRVAGPRGVLELSLEDLEGMAVELDERDFHCVTGWSVRGNRWLGVRLAEVARMVGAGGGGGWLLALSLGGYSTVAPLEEALRDDAIIAIGLNGSKLTRESGSPARLVIPRLYGWKSAKWLRELVILEGYVDGYWEALAYHERGLVEAEERFKVRNPEIAERGELPGGPRPIRPL